MSKLTPRPKSGIPKLKTETVVRYRRSAPPESLINNPKAIYQNKNDADKYLTKRVILNARKTGHLNLSGKGIATVPDRVYNLEDAEEEMRRTDQTFLKSELEEKTEEEADVGRWERKDLRTLDLSHNNLAVISPAVSALTFLVTLDLHDNKLLSLPPELGSLPSLEHLDLSHNELVSLPAALFATPSLPSLRWLSLSHNKLASLPDQLGDLIRLEALDVSQNQLPRLPLAIGFLSALTCLDAAHNRLDDVPPELGGLAGLTRLSLGHNAIVRVTSLADLRRLQVLQLQDNRLSQLPDLPAGLRELHLAANQLDEIPREALDKMTAVRVLNLRDNRIHEIPEDISRLQSLTRLDLANNALTEVPACVGFLPQLQVLLLDGNPLRAIRPDMLRGGTPRLLRMLRGGAPAPAFSPAAVGASPRPLPDKYRMRGSRALSLGMHGLVEIPAGLFVDAAEAQVEAVDLCKNQLQALPMGVALLAGHLTELNLSDNRLSELPSGVLGQCKRLHFIDLQKNALATLPADVQALHQLREINLSYNRFSSVPEPLTGLPGLEILLLCDNKIGTICVPQLSSHPRLAVLDLGNNNIGAVPPELGLLRLTDLRLEGNTFRIPRHEVLAKGTASVLAYLRDRIPRAANAPFGPAAPPPAPAPPAPDPPRQNSYTSHIHFE